MFYDPTAFAFARTLGRNTAVIRAELLALDPGEFQPWVEHDLYGQDGWRIFPFFSGGRYEEGKYAGLPEQYQLNASRCPRTMEILGTLPGCVTAGFSMLLPGAHIVPHCGEERGLYRCHLCLVEAEDCALSFGADTRAWREGEVFVFEDTAMHEAWNRGTRARIVLLTDFEKAAYPLPSAPRAS